MKIKPVLKKKRDNNQPFTKKYRTPLVNQEEKKKHFKILEVNQLLSETII